MDGSDMTDNAGQMGNVRPPTAGQKAGHSGAPPLGGDPLSGLSERALLPPRKRKGCEMTSTITIADLIALWREAGARQLAEADALEARAHGS